MNTYPHLSCFGISKLIANDVIDIWKAVNPRLPLLKEINVVNKVKICFQKAKQISRKHLPAAKMKFWKEKLDTFLIYYHVRATCQFQVVTILMSNAPKKIARLSTSSTLVLWQKSQQKSMKISPPIASTLYVQGDSSHS